MVFILNYINLYFFINNFFKKFIYIYFKKLNLPFEKKKINFFKKKNNFLKNKNKTFCVFNFLKKFFKNVLILKFNLKNIYFNKKINLKKIFNLFKKQLKLNFLKKLKYNLLKLENFLINNFFIYSQKDILFLIKMRVIFLNKICITHKNYNLKKYDIIEFFFNKNFLLYFKKTKFLKIKFNFKKKKNWIFFYSLFYFNLKNFFEIDIFSLSIVILNFFKKNFFNLIFYFKHIILWLNWLMWKNK